MLIGVLIALLLAAGAAAIVYDRARTEAAGLRLLIEMSGLLQVSTSFNDAVEIVPVFGRHLFPELDGALYVSRGSRLELASSWGNGVRHDETHAVDCADECNTNDGTSLCLPLIAGRDTIGVLTLRARDGRSLKTRTELFASAFADHIALALTNLRLQETLRTRAVRDSLTGVFNRRYMEEALARELQRARDARTKTGVIVVDVDHFKAFNDTYGHGGGDALLVQLARVMQSAFEHDFICRYGGDEFVIIVPDTTPSELQMRTQQLRDAVRELRINADGRVLGSATISTGFSFAPDHGITVDALIAAADLALYQAKTAGRDRVASAPYVTFDAA
jgi:diguanylate cyclase (GGDEF)-like protein